MYLYVGRYTLRHNKQIGSTTLPPRFPDFRWNDALNFADFSHEIRKKSEPTLITMGLATI